MVKDTFFFVLMIRLPFSLENHQNHSFSISQKARLGLFRHDYMLHEATDNKILQLVELNTISCSLSVLSPTVARLHRFLAFKYPSKYPYSYEQVLDTESDRETPRTMYEAWKLYNRPNSVILFIVLANERNISEHKDIEYALAERKVRVIRKTFTQVHEEGKLASDGALLIGDHEIAVVYFRTGYMPDQYASQKEWDARLMIERSLAIKTPSVDYQLIGLKKIQQVLSLPGTLERFLPDEPEKVQRLRSSFTGNYELGQEDSDILKEIRKRPQDFVMKPQREGGGNNFYGEEIIKQLDKIKPEERKIYVVMDKIVPKPRSTYFHHNDEISIQEETISEVGTFANFLSDGEKILINQYGGYAVKTKSIKNSEGGVLAGFAAVDSLCLVDE
eukprot:TRINITY_DN934_c0_g1_i2.p1 TRINITY_DN934_c0_g1~~TRINITY_DN934_c0_g1_i2.p1  ORF type:complete len:389 (-),score=77.39 TRINITY_DN934_c0_g1_i2:24-1190(-)